MKVTKSYIKQIIKEEYNNIQEMGGSPIQKAQRAISDAIEEIQLLLSTENISSIRYSLEDPVLGYLEAALKNLSEGGNLEETNNIGEEQEHSREKFHDAIMKNRVHFKNKNAEKMYSNVQLASMGRVSAGKHYSDVSIYDGRRDGKGTVSVYETDVKGKQLGSISDPEIIKRCTEVMDAYREYMGVKS